VGDSTTAVIGGWGPSFCAKHVTSFIACVNLARGGRSSGNYRAEGSWDLALAEMSTPGFVRTYVLIQFGHNDQPGKPGRSTDLATEFPANLRHYVTTSLRRGREARSRCC
jgi:lysophospholipase L1-like esterase